MSMHVSLSGVIQLNRVNLLAPPRLQCGVTSPLVRRVAIGARLRQSRRSSRGHHWDVVLRWCSGSVVISCSNASNSMRCACLLPMICYIDRGLQSSLPLNAQITNAAFKLDSTLVLTNLLKRPKKKFQLFSIISSFSRSIHLKKIK